MIRHFPRTMKMGLLLFPLSLCLVIPANAGIQIFVSRVLDSRFHGNNNSDLVLGTYTMRHALCDMLFSM